MKFYDSKFSAICLVFLLTTISYNTANASPTGEEGIRFEKDDWILACDNWDTCRAAGYSEETSDNMVSVLLTRHNDNQPIEGKMVYQTEKELTRPFKLIINNKSYGSIPLSEGSLSLTQAQTDAIIATANQHADIRFISGSETFILSDKGLSAVLRKMDDIQRRVGTTTAIVAKGNKPYHFDNSVGVALQSEADFLQKEPITIKRDSAEGKRILALLRPTLADEHDESAEGRNYCPNITDEGKQWAYKPDIEVLKLSKTKKLVMASCWTGAYNEGNGAWVMDNKLTQVEHFVTDSMNEFDNRLLIATHKDRGLGDCWNNTEWTWTGENFVKTYAMDTGLCRGFAGGAWVLPTLFISTDWRNALDEN